MIPDVAIHGTWVRSLIHDGFGRICYEIQNRHKPGSIEFLVMWEPDKDLGTTNMTASYHDAEDLMVRPYKPRPWYDEDERDMVIVYGDLRRSQPMSEV